MLFRLFKSQKNLLQIIKTEINYLFINNNKLSHFLFIDLHSISVEPLFFRNSNLFYFCQFEFLEVVNFSELSNVDKYQF